VRLYKGIEKQSISVLGEFLENSLVSGEAESLLSGILLLDLLLEIGGGSSLSLGFELFDEGLFSPAD
jgi:hypothetical protein